MIKTATMLFLIVCLNIRLFSQTDTLEKLLIAEIDFGQANSRLEHLKVEAAMNLVARFSQKFTLIPTDVRDSLASLLHRNGLEPTPEKLARELSARKILIIKVKTFANILRADIFCYDMVDSSINHGKGYAPIRYFVKDKHTPLIDPAILTGLQRAFADMLEKPELYQHLEGNLKVKPASPLVIGTINYTESDTLSKWEIFRKRQVTSYFAVETIFAIARQSSDFVVFDIPTRDSIYSYFKLYEPENYAPPNLDEIQALLKFEVEYYISGEFFWDNGDAILKLYLCKITENGLEILKESATVVKEDSLEAFKQALELATEDLFNLTND
ncbi:MAG: hypothetical protein ACK42Z_03605 [Candidatus Kapaibacteriota bacterium]